MGDYYKDNYRGFDEGYTFVYMGKSDWFGWRLR